MDLASRLALYGKEKTSDGMSGSQETVSEIRSAKKGETSGPQAATHTSNPDSPSTRSVASETPDTATGRTSPSTDYEKENAPSAGEDGASWVENKKLDFEGMELDWLAPGLYRRQKEFSALHLGNTRLEDLLKQPMQFLDDLLPHASRRREAPAMVHRSEVLFLDTETTGLSRGPGNFPFLYGLAWLRGDRLIFEQYFLDGPGGEEAFHSLLQEKLQSFGAVCTYNGKSFDLPVIRNRFVLLGERLRAPAIHLDLFHFWKSVHGGFRKGGRTKGFKQKDLEGRVLGFEREGDLPGSEVPQVYFDYRKYQRKGKMAGVLHHNELDLLGLALLFLKAIELLHQRRDQTALFRAGIARMFWKHGKSMEAQELLLHLNESSDYDSGLLYSDRRLLALILKRNGDHSGAYRVFESLYNGFHCMHSAVEMARYHEFRKQDRKSALMVVDQALDFMEFRGTSAEDRTFLDLMKRKRRLEKALSKEQKGDRSCRDGDVEVGRDSITRLREEYPGEPHGKHDEQPHREKAGAQ